MAPRRSDRGLKEIKKMQHITNIFIIMPEIFLTVAITLLLGFGVVYSKKEGQISQQKKIT